MKTAVDELATDTDADCLVLQIFWKHNLHNGVGILGYAEPGTREVGIK